MEQVSQWNGRTLIRDYMYCIMFTFPSVVLLFLPLLEVPACPWIVPGPCFCSIVSGECVIYAYRYMHDGQHLSCYSHVLHAINAFIPTYRQQSIQHILLRSYMQRSTCSYVASQLDRPVHSRSSSVCVLPACCRQKYFYKHVFFSCWSLLTYRYMCPLLAIFICFASLDLHV